MIATCANTECAADETCSESSGTPVCVNVCDGACAVVNGAGTVAAECQATGGQASCTCPEGYSGNANAGGSCIKGNLLSLYFNFGIFK